MRIVSADNFGRDYSNEKFINIPDLLRDDVKAVCDILNNRVRDGDSRYYKVVKPDYKLVGGFEL